MTTNPYDVQALEDGQQSDISTRKPAMPEKTTSRSLTRRCATSSATKNTCRLVFPLHCYVSVICCQNLSLNREKASSWPKHRLRERNHLLPFSERESTQANHLPIQCVRFALYPRPMSRITARLLSVISRRIEVALRRKRRTLRKCGKPTTSLLSTTNTNVCRHVHVFWLVFWKDMGRWNAQPSVHVNQCAHIVLSSCTDL